MAGPSSPLPGSFAESDHPLSRRLVRPLREFMALEASGGIALLIATAIALIWANSPWGDSYERFWHIEAIVRVGDFAIEEDLRHWVNDGLMAIFFFVVGLEIKRELVTGELNETRTAIFPAIGALGGMVVPATIYAVLNAGGEGSAGWGIPMATDIAFAVGVLTLMGPRCHPSMKIFLLSLAIVDDIGAILVIALFYSGGIDLTALAVAVFALCVMVLLRGVDVWWTPVYVAIGVVVWVATLKSGVHATIAGVILGLMAPARPVSSDEEVSIVSDDPEPSPHSARSAQMRAVASVAVTDRLEHILHPWTSYAIIPIFALANAGVVMSADSLREAATSRVTLGIVLGLVVGKILGIVGFSWLAVRLKIASIPPGADWRQLFGVAAVAGIGFTVSLFIAGLAFDDPVLVDDSKVAILVASVVASLLTLLIFRTGKGDPTVLENTDSP